MATQEIKIVNGPSKFDLMLCNLTGKEIDFTLDSSPTSDSTLPHVIRTIWIAIEPESGNGESWCIKFHSTFPVHNTIFVGYYSTKDRTGILRLEEANASKSPAKNILTAQMVTLKKHKGAKKIAAAAIERSEYTAENCPISTNELVRIILKQELYMALEILPGHDDGKYVEGIMGITTNSLVGIISETITRDPSIEAIEKSICKVNLSMVLLKEGGMLTLENVYPELP